MPRNLSTTETDPSIEPVAKCSLWICLDCGWRDWGARAVGALNCCERCGSARLDESDEDLGCGPPGVRGASLAF